MRAAHPPALSRREASPRCVELLRQGSHERVRPLDVSDVPGGIDQVQRPAESLARTLGKLKRNEPVVPAPEQAGRDGDSPQLGVWKPLRAAGDQLPHRALDVWHACAVVHLLSEGIEPAGLARPEPLVVEERPALEPLGVISRRPQAEPDRDDAQAERHPVGPDRRGAVEDQPAHQPSMLCRQPGGEAAAERVGHERGRIVARVSDQIAEPFAEHVVKVIDRLRLAEAREVGDDHPVALGETRDHRSPDRPGALDPAVQQYQRRALTGLEKDRRDPGEAQGALLDGHPGEHPGAAAHDGSAASTVTPASSGSTGTCCRGRSGASARPAVRSFRRSSRGSGPRSRRRSGS